MRDDNGGLIFADASQQLGCVDAGTDGIVYVGKSPGAIDCVDDVGDSNTIETLTDGGGNTISRSDGTGVA